MNYRCGQSRGSDGRKNRSRTPGGQVRVPAIPKVSRNGGLLAFSCCSCGLARLSTVHPQLPGASELAGLLEADGRHARA